MLVYLPMFTNSIADHMRVVKPLAPAGYLQAHAFNLDRNHFAMTPGTPSAHGRRAVWRGTIHSLLVGPGPYGQPQVVRDLDLSKANRAFAVGISR